MSPPDAPRPPGGTGGRAEDGGAELDTDHTHTGQGYRTIGGQIEPAPVPVHVVVPEDKADKNYSPAPDWVAALIEPTHRVYPAKKAGKDDNRRAHINVWELLVRRLPLRSHAKLVATILAEFWPNIFPSLATIAELSSLSRTTVNHGIYMLVNAGLLKVESRKGESTRYVPCYPERAITEAEVEVAFQWRRVTKGGTKPGTKPDPLAVKSGEDTRPPRCHPPDPQATQPDPQATLTRPPGGREVNNEATREDRAEVLALADAHPRGLVGVMADRRSAQAVSP